MASDGDMFAQRKVWGFNKLCAAMADRSDVSRLIEIAIQCVKNMLRNRGEVPSLRPTIDAVWEILSPSQPQLDLIPVHGGTRDVIERIHRTFALASNAAEVSKAVMRAALGGNVHESKETFSESCYRELGRLILDRYCFDLQRIYVITKGRYTRPEYDNLAEQVKKEALAPISALIAEAAQTPCGRLSRRRQQIRIDHTLEGLTGALL